MALTSADITQAGEHRSARVESLRALAALAVLVCHVFAYAHGWRAVIFQGYLHRAIMGGGFGVELFFCLSGFLLYRAFARRDFGGGDGIDLKAYSINRALRILPLYYVAVVLLLVLTQHGGSSYQWSHFLTFSEEFSTRTAQTVDGPLWSLVVEVGFYILLPLLAWIVARLSQGSVLRAGAVLTAVGGASLVLYERAPSPAVIWNYSLPVLFFAFIPGMLLALVQTAWAGRRPSWLSGPAASSDVWMVAGVAVWLVVCWRYTLIPLTAVASGLVVGACVLPLRPGRLAPLLDWRPLALLGLASYSLYVWHVPIITEIQAHAPHGTLGLLLVVLPLALAAAAVSYRVVEQPPLRYRRRWTVPREAPGVPTSAPADADHGLGPRGFGWLLGAAGAVRLALIVGTPHLPIRNDAADYNRLGRLLAAGHGFGTSALAAAGGPTTFRAPLYPWFLAAVYRLTGDSVTAARCVEAALGVVTVGLVALIADLVWGRRVAWVAAAIAAVLPSLVISSTSVLSESLYMPLEAAAVAAALLAMRTGPRRWWWAALSGLCAGLGILDRPAGFVLVAALAVIVVAGWTHERRELGRRLGTAAVLIVTAVAVLVPWVARDEGTFHALVPVTDIDGFNLAGVYNPVVAGEPYPVAYQWQPPTSSPLFADRSLNEVQLGDALRRQALRWMQDHPTSVVAASFWNTWRMAELTGIGGSTFALDDSGYGRHVAWLEMLSFWLLAVLAAAGLLTRRARTAPLGLWLAPVALWAITTPVLGGSRLRAPIDLFLVLAAAVAVDALARPRPPVPPPSEPKPSVESRLPADSVV